MNDAIQFHSRVGDDGILNVQVNLGRAKAQKQVVVTIEPTSAGDSAAGDPAEQATAMAWPDFIQSTYGSCAGLGLERREEGAFESHRER